MYIWERICQRNRTEPFWLGIPTPVIYLRNHFFSFLFFSGLSTLAEGPAVAFHSFRCGELPFGFKSPEVGSAEKTKQCLR